MATVMTIANQKGGVGKTTTAVSIASALQMKNYRVLLIDTDPQCNSTDTYRAEHKGCATLYDLLGKTEAVNDVIQTTEFGDIIASDPLLTKADIEYTKTGREYLLEEAIAPIKKLYDYIVIDTSPSLGILLINALTASDGIIIPIIADRYSLQGLESLNDTIISTQKYTNSDLKIFGLLVTMYQGNTIISKEVMKILPEFENIFNVKAFDTKIRMTTKVKESTGARTPLINYDKNNIATQDYITLIEEIERKQKNG